MKNPVAGLVSCSETALHTMMHMGWLIGMLVQTLQRVLQTSDD